MQEDQAPARAGSTGCGVPGRRDTRYTAWPAALGSSTREGVPSGGKRCSGSQGTGLPTARRAVPSGAFLTTQQSLTQHWFLLGSPTRRKAKIRPWTAAPVWGPPPLLPTSAAPASPITDPSQGLGPGPWLSPSLPSTGSVRPVPAWPPLLLTRPWFCSVSAPVICSNRLHDVLESLLPNQGQRVTAGPAWHCSSTPRRHCSCTSMQPPRATLGAGAPRGGAWPLTHLSSSSSSRFTDPTTSGPWYTSAVYICTSEAPARIFSRASRPLLTPPTPMMGTRPAGRRRVRRARATPARAPKPCSAPTSGEGVHLPDGLRGELPQRLPAEAPGLCALPAPQAAGAAHGGVADNQPVHT